MNIGLIAVDSKRLNLALGKLSTYHKSIGDSVEWYSPFEHYDFVYVSKIFNFSPDYAYPINADVVVRGGTGYSLVDRIPAEAEKMQPDYSLWPNVDNRTSYGFLTRGCPNKCAWCVVPRCSWEGPIHPDHDIDDITLGGRRPYAVLQDNNILALPDYAEQQLLKIIDRGYHIDFNQAIDARLVDSHFASLLARCKWIGSLIRFGCDTPKQIQDCERAIQLLVDAGYRGQFMLYTIIMGDIHECVDRISHWKTHPLHNRIRVAAQPYRPPFLNNTSNPPSGNGTSPDGPTERNSTPPPTSPTSASPTPSQAPTTYEHPQWQRDLAVWANRRQLWWSCSFADFSPRRGFRCTSHLTSNPPKN